MAYSEAKKRSVCGSSGAAGSTPSGIRELLSLWGETNARPLVETTAKEAGTEQILLRLQQTGVPERLEKATEQEKASWSNAMRNTGRWWNWKAAS